MELHTNVSSLTRMKDKLNRIDLLKKSDTKEKIFDVMKEQKVVRGEMFELIENSKEVTQKQRDRIGFLLNIIDNYVRTLDQVVHVATPNCSQMKV